MIYSEVSGAFFLLGISVYISSACCIRGNREGRTSYRSAVIIGYRLFESIDLIFRRFAGKFSCPDRTYSLLNQNKHRTPKQLSSALMIQSTTIVANQSLIPPTYQKYPIFAHPSTWASSLLTSSGLENPTRPATSVLRPVPSSDHLASSVPSTILRPMPASTPGTRMLGDGMRYARGFRLAAG